MVPAIAIAMLLILIYGVLIFILAYGLSGLKRCNRQKPSRAVPVVIIVPFRDEQDHIADLAHDLLAQVYPEEQMQVVFVNDHSRDDSRKLLETVIAGREGFSCHDLPPDRTGKKDALQFGMELTAGDWIIQTDADCRIGPYFIASHMAHLESYPADLVAGLVTTGEGPAKPASVFERLDLLGLVGAGAGSYYYKRPMMCNGANLLYSRWLYEQSRLFDPYDNVASGDDMFLMIGARKLGRVISFNPAPEAVAVTSPASGFGTIFRQRIRWGAKSVHYRMWDIQLLAVAVTMANLALLWLFIRMFVYPASWPWMLGAWALKTGADFLMLYRITGLTGQRKSLWYFLPVSIFYYIYFPVVIAGMLLVRPRWKHVTTGKPVRNKAM